MHRVLLSSRAARRAIAALLLSACEGSGSPGAVMVAPTPPETVATIEIARLPARIEVGDSVQLTAVVRSNRGRELADRVVAWTSSNAAVASVSSAGRLIGLAPGGPLAIRAEVTGISSTVEVSIERAAVATVSLAQSAPVVMVGARLPLTAVLRDGRGAVLTNRSITWTSADPTIVTVSDSGVLTGVRPGGPVLVTAVSEGKQSTANVTVTPVPTSLIRVDQLRAGATARLVGRGLSQTSSVLVDAAPVAFQIESDSVLRFAVPTLRRCDVDGRTVALTVQGTGQAILRSALQVSTAALSVGQSIVVQADTLGCIQLPARNEDYVLTVLNPEIPVERTATSPWPLPIIDLLTFNTGSSSLRVEAVRSEPMAALGGGANDEWFAREVRSIMASVTGPYSDNPTLFDPRYATAAVGDTVRFPIAWRLRQQPNYCGLNRTTVRSDSALSYPVLFVAQSAFLTVGIDLRMSNASQYATGEGRRYLQRAADAAAPYILPAARIAFDASYQPMKGAGSRHFVVVTTPQLYDPSRGEWSGIAGDVITEMPQSYCALNSETHAVFVSATAFQPNGASGFLASVVLHEFGHQADQKFTFTRGLTHGHPEQWATIVQEIAMRLALGQPTQARYSELGQVMPFEPNLLATTWGRRSAQRLYEPPAVYSHYALFMTLMREWAGETSLTPRVQTFYEQYLSLRYRWQSFQAAIEAQAQTLRTTPFDLLDRYVLAVTTDDLVEPSAAARFNLPQIQSWDSRSYPGVPASISRTTPVRRTLAAGPGGYDVAYFLSNGQQVGVSLAITDVAKVPMRIRLTRLR